MQRYANLGGDSGIEAFRIEPDGICVQFVKAENYTYTVDSVGTDHIENMKRLALQGEGLHEYINRNRDVYKGWVKKNAREMYR
jgi:hypothetical protein